jgi:protein-tyrosine phosphatase
LTQIAADAPCGENHGSGNDRERLRALVTAPGRRIDLAGMSNLRDLGGYPTASGQGAETPWHTLFRSDALHQLSEPAVEALAGLGLRTIVDLRTHVEAEFAPSPLDWFTGRHTHVSILGADLESLPQELDGIYAYVIDNCGADVAEAIRPLCAGPAFPALVHCSAGKDRTGIVIALVLAVLGVPDEIIAADYALSGGYLNRQSIAAIGHLQASAGLGDELATELLASPPQLILGVLNRARASHGSVEQYLLAHGLGAGDVTALRLALISESPASA